MEIIHILPFVIIPILRFPTIVLASSTQQFNNIKMTPYSSDVLPAKRPEIREKIRLSKLGQKPSLETREKLAEIARNRFSIPENNVMFGKHHSDSSKEKIRLGHFGKKLSEEHKRKIRENHSIYWLGKKRPEFSEEWKRNMGISHKGQHYHNDEWKIINSERMKKWHKEHGFTQEMINKIRLARLNQIIPTEDTSIELKIDEGLNKLRLKYEKHKPIENMTQCDRFIEPNILIFADGCYWHGCPDCYPDRTKLNTMQNKRIISDTLINEYLNRTNKYIVLRFWEHDIENNFEDQVLDKIIFAIKEVIKV